MQIQLISIVSVVAINILLLVLLYGMISCYKLVFVQMAFAEALTTFCKKSSTKDDIEINTESILKFRRKLGKQREMNEWKHLDLILNVLILSLINYFWIDERLGVIVSSGIMESVWAFLLAIFSILIFEVAFGLYYKSQLTTFIISLNEDRFKSKYLVNQPVLTTLIRSFVLAEAANFIGHSKLKGIDLFDFDDDFDEDFADDAELNDAKSSDVDETDKKGNEYT